MTAKTRIVGILAVLAAAAVWAGSASAVNGTYTVDTTADVTHGLSCTNTFLGDCSLRDAIIDANLDGGGALIDFAIPGSAPFVLSLGSALPALTVPNVVVDGTSQAGVDVDGNGLGAVDGLTLGAGATGSTIKGLAITRFGGSGIVVNADSATLTGNFVGTDSSGAGSLGNGTGIAINAASDTVGGSTAAARNVISGNTSYGLFIQGSTNSVTGNYIGTDATGTAAIANSIYGIDVTGAGATNNVIGGSTAALRNVISGNTSAGVVSEGGATGTKIQGNYIGTDAAGANAIANGNGVIAFNGVTIGGTNAGEGNLISGNTFDQVQTNFTETVAGNVIGLNAAGTAALVPGSTATGVEVDGAGATIGGSTAAARNVISGQRDGIILRQSGDNAVVRGNYIGTDVTGTAAVGGRYGIWIDRSSGSDIGGPNPASDGNVLSANVEGVHVDGAGADSNTIRNNFIGTDKNGTAALGNTNAGVDLYNGSTNTVVGGSFTEGNLISGNPIGVIAQFGSTGNILNGNRIGPDATGAGGIGNHTGVEVSDTSTVSIGENYTNTIAFNTGVGVDVVTTTGQAKIRGNDIYSNGGLGIDLEPPTGKNTNDAGDADTGPNNGQNYPVISSATSNGTIDYSLDSKQGDYMVDFFVSSSCDPSGNGEGENFIMSRVTNHTAPDGNQSFSTPVGPLTPGSYVTATATSAGGGATSGDTSEFSNCFLYLGSGATYTVDRTDDVGGLPCTAAPGDCDLRSAIEQANANSGLHDTIDFDLPLMGVNTISLSADLPPITDPVTIDGTTQSGFVGPPIVAVDGGSGPVNLSTGLELAAGSDGSTVRGLVIGNFDTAGVLLESSGNTIEGNYIGVDYTGGGAFGNGTGILAQATSDNNVIGGSDPIDRNVISGNTQDGIKLAQSGGNASDSDSVIGNYVGTNSVGSDPIPNGGDGINVFGGTDILIGIPGAGNVVSGNGAMGIRLEGTTDAKVQDNYVGVDAGGLSPVGNALYGINVRSSTNPTIGGTSAFERNVVGGNLAGLYLEFNDGAVVQGNYVGLGADGVSDVGNHDPLDTAGITIDQASSVPGATPTLIGGTAPGAGNYISNNTQGIAMYDADAGTTVQGNVIGLDVNDNAAGNQNDGIEVFDTPGVLIGWTTEAGRNVISESGGAGVAIEESGGATIQGNSIGTDPTGLDGRGNSRGIYVSGDSPNAVIGGAAAQAGEPPGNLIVDGDNEAILLEGNAGPSPRGAHVRGNMIGLDSTGTSTLPNYGAGIAITAGAHDNVIGNDTGSGSDVNVVSASGDGTAPGVWIDGAGSDNNTIVGNRLGTNRDGTNTGPYDTQNGNGQGVWIKGGAQHNTVGGATPDLRNLIGANDTGIQISDPLTGFNTVQGNWLGIAVDGTTELQNREGVVIDNGAHDNLIGGTAAGEGNLIASSTFDGVQIDGSGVGTSGNSVKGNSIGVAADLTTPMQTDIGVELSNQADNNVVGGDIGDPASAGNLIANSGDTTVLVNNTSNGNRIALNTIRDSSGDGIGIISGSAGTTVFKNTITGSGAAGVRIADGLGNKLDQNSIDGSTGLGIDLGPPGVTPNDAGDGDTGANDLQNFPDVTGANIDGSGDLTIDGTLDSNPLNAGSTAASYRIEVFASPACNPSGYGEGAKPLGSAVVVVDGSGHATWQVVDPATDVIAGQVVTTTATDEENNTSEFSQCFTVTNLVTPLDATISLGTTQQDVRAGAQSVPIAGIDLSALTQGAGGTTSSAPLAGIPLAGIDVAGSPLAGIPLAGIGFTPALLNQALGGVHLSDIPLQPPANWPALLTGTPLANVPLSTLTLADVLELPNPPTSGLTIGQIGLRGTPLAGIPLAGISLGPKQLSAVPLAGIGASPAQNLQAWCDAINRAPGYSCASATALTGQTVMSQVIQGVPLAGIPLDAIPLAGIDLSGTPLAGIPLAGIDLHGTPLAGIPLAGIDLRVSPLAGIPLAGITIAGSPLAGIPLAGIGSGIDCGTGYCVSHTLGDAERDGKILPGATLAILDGHFGTITLESLVDALKPGGAATLADLAQGLPASPTLHDLLSVLLGGSAYDWSQLDLATFPLADFSSDGGVAHYTATFQVTGGALPSQPADIHATVPDGGRYVPHSSQLNGSPAADPDVGPGGGLTWHVSALVGQVYTLEWDAKPGLDLGTSPVSANIQVGSVTGLSNTVQTTVIQTFNTTNSPTGDTNNDPATAPQLAGNSLYVSQLTKGDVDYYRIPIGPYGSRVQVTLSHIPAGSDYDLAAAGPPAPRLRSAPANGIPLTNQQLPDTAVDLDHRAQQLPPEALQDVPTGALTTGGNVIRAVSDNRGTADEQVTLISEGESGFYTVQVSDYQGDSPSPYVLQVQTDPAPTFGACAPRSIANGAAAAPAPVTAATQTLFLVDEQRLIATFGSTATSNLMTKLNGLAARTDVNGVVVPVENGPGVAAAYNAWDANPCSPELANNTVRAIGSYLDSLENTAVNVKYIVVVGGDDIVPFARTPDETEVANERTYQESLGSTNNEYLGSIGSGFLLTDDVWGEKGAPTFLGHELFVPEQAVGRLVESPADITKTIDDYTAANGLLTPTSSLVTGYDFLTDGAQSINQPFAAGFGTNAKTLISETWDRTAFLNALFPASGAAPVLNSLNAHFDHHRLLPAAENAADRQTNLVTTDDITSRGATIMTGRLGFSLGCHSGLAVSDAIFGAANLLRSDWAQAMLGTGAAGWIGNTGYGLGDTTDVAYSERLHSLFARKLDGTLTVGQALEQAKQDYLGTLAVLSPYDAKVMMEATLYGLPMLRLGPGVPPSAPPPPPLHTDPATNLQATSFDVSPTFTAVTTANGKYYRADNGIQSTPRRPLEPLVSLDVTQPGSLVAHGAMIDLLNSPAADETNFDAVFSQVTTDNSADDPTLAGVNSFPSKIQAISTYSGVSTRKQRLNLVVGLFRSDGPTLEGIGTHRRYTRVAGDVLYSTSNDWTPPALGELETLRVGTAGNVGFAANVTDLDQNGNPGTVKEVVVLYRDCNGAWRTSTLSPAGADRWAGGGVVTPSGCQTIDYYLEAADAAGNVAVSSKKVQVEPLVAPPDVVPAGVTPITHTLGGTLSAGGWYTSGVEVTLAGGAGDAIHYSLDGASVVDYAAPFTVTGDGVHIVEATSDRGATHTFGFVIDGTGPTAKITRTPGTPDVNGWYTFNVLVQVAATDAGGSEVARIRCVLDPATVPTSFSQLPSSCPYTGSGGNVMTNGVHTVYAAAIDSAGNRGAVVSNTFGLDNIAPSTTIDPLSPFQTAPSYTAAWTGNDGNGSGVKNFDIRVRQAASNSSTFGSYVAWQSANPATSAVFSGTLGATTCFSGRARDNAGWTAVQYSPEVCTTAPLDDTSLSRYGYWSTVTASDLYGGSALRTTSPGSVLMSPTMAGRQIGVLVTKQPGGGTIQLRWNGYTQVTQSLSAASRQPKQLVSFTLPSVQTGTLQVYVSGYGTVEVDAAGAYKTP